MSSTLREQSLDYMTLHRFSKHTKKNYILVMQSLTRFYNQPPDALTQEQIQKFLIRGIHFANLGFGLGLPSLYRLLMAHSRPVAKVCRTKDRERLTFSD